ncbi:hypothetical protein M2155_002080 [Streptomyces sp. SAI-119]|uniref:DUF7210 family protein n=1 Tax=Streptomyces sp. SAI-119 TaxID=2940541 RepID=UPI0024748A2A|nr:hypothetical protein [Streptomyces sp. SAI-119]MDH6449672.1 hypothetical protein [Streptomyces sp. SAI-119]
MTTNTTKKTAAAEESPETVTAEVRPERTRRSSGVVGPPLGEGQEPVTVTLSHHLRIDGTDYTPGAEITVSPDYARRLRGQGFTART